MLHDVRELQRRTVMEEAKLSAVVKDQPEPAKEVALGAGPELEAGSGLP
jgi:hypothetical protein